jgi:hypothetical protein
MLLRIKEPRITRAQAAELLIQNDARRIMGAVLDLWGYRVQKKAPLRPPAQGSAPSTGEAFSPASPPAAEEALDSATGKSAG